MSKVKISTENRQAALQAAERHNRTIPYVHKMKTPLCHIAAVHSAKSASNCAAIIVEHDLDIRNY